MGNDYDFAVIDWIDSAGGGDNGWKWIEDCEEYKPIKCRSIGFVFEDEEDYVTLIQSFHDTQLMYRLSIPKVAILNRIDYARDSIEDESEDIKLIEHEDDEGYAAVESPYVGSKEEDMT